MSQDEVESFAAKEKARLAKWRADNPDRARANRKRWRAANLEKSRAIYRAGAAKWAAANPEKKRAASYKWAAENPEKFAAICAKYRASHPEISSLCNAKRRLARVRWGDKLTIRSFYLRAMELTKSTGIKHEVDHIVPLLSPLVCGLHCEANLQILTRRENRSKHNCFSL